MTIDNQKYNPCILYTLPKDVTIQSIGEKRIENALDKLTQFLNNFSDNQIIEFDELVAHIPQPSERNYDAGMQKIEKAKLLFGSGIERSIGNHYTKGGPLPQRKIEWKITSEEVGQYISFIVEQQPISAFELPLFELIGNIYFKLKDKNGATLKGQTFHSNLMVWLGRNSAISPTLWFPFVEADAEFIEYKNMVSEKFPGKFNDRYLRKIRPSKSGTSYQVRKL